MLPCCHQSTIFVDVYDWKKLEKENWSFFFFLYVNFCLTKNVLICVCNFLIPWICYVHEIYESETFFKSWCKYAIDWFRCLLDGWMLKKKYMSPMACLVHESMESEFEILFRDLFGCWMNRIQFCRNPSFLKWIQLHSSFFY